MTKRPGPPRKEEKKSSPLPVTKAEAALVRKHLQRDEEAIVRQEADDLMQRHAESVGQALAAADSKLQHQIQMWFDGQSDWPGSDAPPEALRRDYHRLKRFVVQFSENWPSWRYLLRYLAAEYGRYSIDRAGAFVVRPDTVMRLQMSPSEAHKIIKHNRRAAKRNRRANRV